MVYIINNKRFRQLVGGLIMIKVCSMCSGMSIEDLKAALLGRDCLLYTSFEVIEPTS